MFGWSKERVVQKEAFLHVIGNDLNFIETVISLFEEQAKDCMEILSDSLQTSDWNAFLRATHDLKNTGRSIASQKLIDHSVELEKIASEQSVEKAKVALKNTEKLLNKARTELLEIGKMKGH